MTDAKSKGSENHAENDQESSGSGRQSDLHYAQYFKKPRYACQTFVFEYHINFAKGFLSKTYSKCEPSH